METKDEIAAKISAAIELLKPADNPSPLPGQIEAAGRHIGAARDALSLASKVAMLEGMVKVNAPLKGDIKTPMTGAQFKALASYWRGAREVAKIIGVQTPTIYLYQRAEHNNLRHVPNKGAIKIIEARMKYNIEHNIAEDPILDSVLKEMGLK